MNRLKGFLSPPIAVAIFTAALLIGIIFALYVDGVALRSSLDKKSQELATMTLARDRAVDANAKIISQLDEVRRQTALLVAKTRDLQSKLQSQSAAAAQDSERKAREAAKGEAGPDRFNRLMEVMKEYEL